MSIHPDDIKRVKGQGFLNNKGTDCFNARILTTNGNLSTDQIRAIAEAADTFGNGRVQFTSRMTVELPGIPYDKIEAFQAHLGEHGLYTGGTGPKVRPVVSCKGTTCQYGLYDTFGLSEKIHERFYLGYHDVKLPHKFKIATGGCPNNCVKPDLNDLGIIGQRIKEVDLETCRGCKKCQIELNCPMKAASVVDGKVYINDSLCNNCGRCAAKCPFGAFGEGKPAWKVCIGGRWGKKVAQGKPLGKLFTSEEEVLRVVEKTILLFREQGLPGERFADTITRLGFENVEAQLLSDEILARKDEILKD
ncbi:MAG: (4Fe-4S)-binding protein [Ruminococcaceae bacterium]|nr:(4Fe-4S)-binding protein [Oscillospiraceae bacterium]